MIGDRFAKDVERREAIVKLSGIGWDDDDPPYRDIYTRLYLPNGSAAQRDWFNRAQRGCGYAAGRPAIALSSRCSGGALG